MKQILMAFYCVLATVGLAQAEDYPTKPVRLIVSVPPGGPADTEQIPEGMVEDRDALLQIGRAHV